MENRNTFLGLDRKFVKLFHKIMLIAILHSSLIAPSQQLITDYINYKDNRIYYLGSQLKFSNYDKEMNNIKKIVENYYSQSKDNLVKTSSNNKTKENIKINSLYFSSDIREGVIGVSSENPLDDPSDNLFKINIDKFPTNETKVFLTYDVYGIHDFQGVARSINNRPSTGGYLVKKIPGWTSQKEEINIEWLTKGINHIFFSIPKGSNHNYKIKNLTIKFENNTSLLPKLVITTPLINYVKDNQFYIKGFIRNYNNKDTKILIEDQLLNINDGEFEGIYNLSESVKQRKFLVLKAVDKSGLLGQEIIMLDNLYEADKIIKIENIKERVEKLFKGNEQNYLKCDGASIFIRDTSSLCEDKNIKISKLRSVDIAPLSSGMINVTKDGSGFRFLPDATTFNKPVELIIDYDEKLIPEGYSPNDIKTFYFDTNIKNWIPIKRDTINLETKSIISLTTHFTDYINGIIQTPESPETAAFTPTMMNDIKAADPSSEITLINPPQVSQKGEANISYPIKIPSGRLGMQPNLVVQYNSDAGNGWLGEGWDINMPAITIDTKWGVPTFNSQHESEIYNLNGEQLMYPKITNLQNELVDWMPNRHYDADSNSTVPSTADRVRITNAVFTPRKQGSFAKIERIGSNPTQYYWKVTDTNGTINWYGGSTETEVTTGNAILRDPSNNIVHWGLFKTQDKYGNTIKYVYEKQVMSGLTGDKENLNDGVFFHIKEILYNGFNDAKYGYKVEFTTTNTVREDVNINARLGIKQVTPYFLNQIIVKRSTNPNAATPIYDVSIRKYNFETTSGIFNKSQLLSIAELNGNNEEFYRHTFEYYNDLWDGKENVLFNSPIDINLPNLSSPNPKFTLGVGLLGASRININEDIEYGWEIRPSIGLEIKWKNISNDEAKTLMFGLPFGKSYPESKGVITMVDMDGNGLDDIVYRTNEGIKYFQHFYDPISNTNYFGNNPINVYGIDRFYRNEGVTQNKLFKSWDLKFKLFFKGSKPYHVGKREFISNSETNVYFTDGNSDGLIDIVKDENVVFNKGLNEEGNQNDFTTASNETPNMLITADASISPPVELTENITDESLYDVVRVWEAPKSGIITIKDSISLNSISNPSNPINQESKAIYIIETSKNNINSGVPFRLFLQEYNSVNPNENINISNYAGNNPNLGSGNNSALEVDKGQRFYFRLINNNQGKSYVLDSNPEIEYINEQDPVNILKDENLDNHLISKYSDAFILNDKQSFEVPATGTVTIEWPSIPLQNLSDDVTYKIIKTKTTWNSGDEDEETEIYSYTHHHNDAPTILSGNITESIIIPLDEENNKLESVTYNFYVSSDSNLKWKEIEWKPTITFVRAASSTTELNNIKVFPVVEHSIYKSTFTRKLQPQLNWSTPTSPALYGLKPLTNVNLGPNKASDFIMIVKKNGTILGKRKITVNNNGDISLDNNNPILFDSEPFSIYSPENQLEYTIGFYTDNQVDDELINDYLIATNNHPVLIGYDFSQPPASNSYLPINVESCYNKLERFGPMYREWGQFFYNDDFDLSTTIPSDNISKLLNPIHVNKIFDSSLTSIFNNNCDPNSPDYEECSTNASLGTVNPPGEDEQIDPETIPDFPSNPMFSEINAVFLIAKPARSEKNFNGRKEVINMWKGLFDSQYTKETNFKSGKDEDDFYSTIFAEENYTDQLIEANSTYGMPARTRFVESKSVSKTAGWGQFNISKSNSKYSDEIESFMDVNGDRYPDIFTKDNINFTKMTGGFNDYASHNYGVITSNKNNSVRITASGKGAANGRINVNNSGAKIDEGNPSAFQGINASINIDIDNKQNKFWMDINGDGLSDRIIEDNGYKFYLNSGKITSNINYMPFNLLSSVNTKPNALDINVSYNLDINELFSDPNALPIDLQFSAGYSKNASTNKVSFQDINSDGLMDLILSEPNLPLGFVRFNNGNGFNNSLSPLKYLNSSSTLNLAENNKSSTLTINGQASKFFRVFSWFKIKWLRFFHIKAGLSASGNANLTLSNVQKEFKDFDGDGFTDFIERDGNNIKLYSSRIKRTNKLKSVTNPLKGSFTIDYKLQNIDFNNPNPKWAMSTVIVKDGYIKDDGVSEYRKDFVYENGKYDRRERAFYGYETVKIIEGDINSPYRTTVSKYHNNSYFLNGLLKETYLLKGNDENQKFSKTVNSYAIKKLDDTNNAFVEPQVNLPETFDVGGTEGRRSAAVVLTSTTDEYYDLDNTNIQITTTNNLEYDKKGNVITYINNGNTLDPNDDYKATITYHNNPTTNATLISKNIISVPKLLTITNVNGSTLYKKRETLVNSTNGNITTIKANYSNTAWTTTSLGYDTYGHLTTLILPNNAANQSMKYTYAFDTTYYKYIYLITDSYGYSSTETYDANFDKRVRTREDHTGNTTAHEYDSFGRNTKITGPNEYIASDLSKYTIKFNYYPKFSDLPANSGIEIGQFVPVAVTKHFDTQNLGNDIETYTFVDGLARPIQIKKDVQLNTGTAQSPITTEAFTVSGMAKYDAFGRVIEQFHPVSEILSSTTKFLFNDDLGDYSSTIEYDELDRVINSYDPIGNGTSNSYTIVDNLSGVSYPLFKILTSTQQNNTNSIVNETYKDVSGKTIATINIGDVNLQTRFNYNPVGDLVSYTDADNLTTSYTYDLLGRKKTMLSPDSGLTSYAYDNANHITSVQTKNLAQNTSLPSANRFIKYNYNFNQLLSITYPPNANGTANISNVTYTYGTITGNNRGRIVSQTDATGTQTFDYGKMGEVVSNTRTVVGPNIPTRTFTTKYIYDSWNRLQELEYPDQEKVTFKYDLGGNLNKVSGTLNGAPYDYIKRIDYDHYEQRTYLKYGNNTETSYTYTPELRRLSNLNVKTSSQVAIFDNNYQYDYVGNVTSLVNSATSTDLGGSYSHTYTYDKFNRLETAIGNFQGSQAQQTAGNDYTSDYDLVMEYNNTHGITTKTQRHNKNNTVYVPNTFRNNYSYYPNTHMLKETNDDVYGLIDNFDYDHNGNLIKKYKSSGEQRTFLWDESNRLRVVADATTMQHYIYDASGERVLKANTSTTAVYQNGTLVSPSNTTINGYTTYPSGFIVVDPLGNYTKHYYAGSQRIVSRFVGSASIFINNSAARTSESPTQDDKKLQKEQKADLQRFLEKASIGKPIYKDFKPYSYEEVNKLLAENEKDKTEGNTNVSNAVDPPVTINTVYYYHPDHLGTSTFLTDYYGAKYQFFLNLPFGETMAEQLPSTYYKTPYKFNGKELDDETGLYYYGARYYDPKISLWLSVDPLAEKMPSWSPYSFCFDNPIRFVDPDGMAPGDPVGPGYVKAGGFDRMVGFTLRHPIAAMSIGSVSHGSTNISTNSARFAINTGLPENKAMEGSHINAFRHTLWQATITQEFGASIAKQAGNTHEDNPFANLKQTSFKTLADADQTIDLLNNQIGREIGKNNPDASMQQLAIETLNYFNDNGLYTATKQKDGTYSIGQTKLTTKQYSDALKTLTTTNQNGYTPAQQVERNAELAKENKRQDLGPKF